MLEPGMNHYYILFDVHNDAMAMYRALRNAGIKAQISPTPRELSVCCGVSLIIREEDIPGIRKLAEEQDLRYREIDGLNNEFNSERHHYI